MIFAATGTGGRTLESLVESGIVSGVLDITTTEWADELCGGIFGAGPTRLDGAGLRGLPQVIAPGCVDMVNFGGMETVPAHYRNDPSRRFHVWNPQVTLMRTTPAENAELGRILAEKANAARGPVEVFLPLRGVSILDSVTDSGPQAFWWPEADAALRQALHTHLRPGIPLHEVDANINDQAFIEATSDAMLRLSEAQRAYKSGGVGERSEGDCSGIWPARNANGVLVNDETPNAMAPGGRLYELVKVGADYPGRVSWFADPELLQAASAMAQGYLVQEDGSPVAGDQSDAVLGWLTSLRSALDAAATVTQTQSQLRVLPYADVDATAVRRADLATDLIRAVTQAPIISRAAIGTPIAETAYWAPGGRIDKQTAELLVSSGVRTVIVSSRAVSTASSAPALASISTTVGALTAVLIDPVLADLLTTPKSGADEVILARQQFLAQAALLATSAAGPARVVVAPLNARWAPDPQLLKDLLDATSAAPWLSMQSIDELLTATPAFADRLNYGQLAKQAELPTAYLQQVMKAQGRLQQFVAILDDPAAISVGFSQAMTRTLSSAWRSQPTTGRTLLKQINVELIEQMGQVRALSKGTITFSGDSGQVPITLANDLDQSVTVSMQLVGVPAARLESPPVTDIVIAAGRKVSVEVEARVIGGDPLPVNIQILTPEGDKYGIPSTITLASTAYSRAASWVVGAAFAAILVFVIVGVTRRIWKAQRSQQAGNPSDTVSP